MNTVSSGAIKCQKCRNILLEDISLVTNNNGVCDTQVCTSYNINKFIYLSEEKLPSWIKLRIENEQWTKGKLNCEKCGSRVGSFDFISGRKCDCGNSVLPPVHFVTSHVDRPIFLNLK